MDSMVEEEEQTHSRKARLLRLHSKKRKIFDCSGVECSSRLSAEGRRAKQSLSLRIKRERI